MPRREASSFHKEAKTNQGFLAGFSHALSTIDMSTAYLGLASFSRASVGALVFAKVYSGPLLFAFALPQLADAGLTLSGSIENL